MKAKFETEKLLKAVSVLTRFTNQKYTVNYQRLLKIRAVAGDIVELSVDNGSTLAAATVTALEKLSAGETVFIDVRFLMSMLSMVQAPQVTLYTERNLIWIDWENGRASTPLESDEFRTNPDIKDPKTSVIKGDDFLAGMKLTNPFVADDELRPMLCSVQVNLGTAKEMVATNSRTVMIAPIPFEGDEGRISIPSDIIRALTQLADREQEMRFTYDDNHCHLRTGDYDITFHQRTGRYPAYRDVIPKDNDSELVVDRKELLEALKRLKVCSDRQKGLAIFELKNEIMSTITISSEDKVGGSKASQTLNCTYNGVDLRIGFRIDEFTAMLGVLQDERVVVKIKDNKHPVIVTCEDTKKYPVLGVTIPLMVN